MVTMTQWTYPDFLMESLTRHGVAPRPETPPRIVRDFVRDLYLYEIRQLRDRRRSGEVAKGDYVGLVVALRKRYLPLSLTPAQWDQICGADPDHPAEIDDPSSRHMGEHDAPGGVRRPRSRS